MRRLLILALLAGLFASPLPACAQSDEAPNKLSLEALTAPPPGGSSGGGYGYGRSRSSAHRGYRSRRSAGRRSYAYRGFHRAPYRQRARFHPRSRRLTNASLRYRPPFYAPRRP